MLDLPINSFLASRNKMLYAIPTWDERIKKVNIYIHLILTMYLFIFHYSFDYHQDVSNS